jgi:hypothetical protein
VLSSQLLAAGSGGAGTRAAATAAAGVCCLLTHRQQLISCLSHTYLHHLSPILCDPLLPLELVCTELLLMPLVPHLAFALLHS